MAEPIYYYTKQKLQKIKQRKGKAYTSLLLKTDRTEEENLNMEQLRNEIIEIEKEIKEMREKI